MKERKYITAVVIIVFILISGIFYGYANMSGTDARVISLSEAEQIQHKNPDEEEKKTDKIQSPEVQKNKKEQPQTEISQEKNAMIYVHMCGQVKKPGVYKVRADSRISDGITAAGGLTQKAASDFVNQAEILKDGMQVYIPSKKEIKKQKSKTEQSAANNQKVNSVDSGKINLNTATKEELMTLPGIGEAKANSIITYREEHGAFQSIEDIKNITGIKDGVFDPISDYITV